MSDFYQRKDISNDTVEFTITIPKDSFESSYKAIMKDKVKNIDIKGFRKGKVPTTLVEPQINQSVKLETLEKIAPLFITTAIQKEQLDPIAPPEYKELPKLEDGKDVELTITVTVMPEFKLANLKELGLRKRKQRSLRKRLIRL
jgi:trigger factor